MKIARIRIFQNFGQKYAFLLMLYLSLCPEPSHEKPSRPKSRGRVIPQRELDTRNADTQKKIVLIHNFYRARVDPPAENMLEMTWHKEAQEQAQTWANACQKVKHDKPLTRRVNDYGSCGQNIFVSSNTVDWMHVAKAWYSEHKNFTYGSRHNNVTSVGHYTQMVWYNSHKVGCGFKYCAKSFGRRPFYNYICNYCPVGNIKTKIGKPYSEGKPCDKCKGHCKYKKLCTNRCAYFDFWANCADLNSSHHSWLCEDKTSRSYKACQASCDCPDAIF